MIGFDDAIRLFPVDPEVKQAFDALPNELNEHGYDPWGFNPTLARHTYSFGKYLYRYFRPVVRGTENIPSGRVLLVANHSGQLPYDGMVLGVSCLLDANPPRIVRAMVERWVPRIPFVNELFARSGAVLGAPINCRNLLEADNAILVFPEGARGCGKTFDNRYKLVDFGRGFMRLALQTNTPIVPISVIGAEESIPSISQAKPLADLVGAPYVPIPYLLPLLGPLAYIPMPTKFHITFGEPMVFDGEFDDEDEVIQEKVDEVRAQVQALVDAGLQERESIF
ncbi:MAG: lysophospholipid acyltransferase family protein [Myxococcota bacterium]